MEQWNKLIDGIAGQPVPDEAKKILLAAFVGTKISWITSNRIGKDVLLNKVAGTPVNFWHLSHALTYLGVGRSFKDNHWSVLRLGALWESYERLLSLFVDEFWLENLPRALEDILANGVGYAIGNTFL